MSPFSLNSVISSVSLLADIIGSRPFIWTQAAQDVLPFLRISMKDIPTGGHPDKFLDRDTLLKGYQVHYNNVRKAVPPERLLEYNVKQGWEPLCEFLKVPVPNVPFPHVNDRFKVQVIIGSLTLITWIWPIVFLFPVLVLFQVSKYTTRTSTPKQKLS